LLVGVRSSAEVSDAGDGMGPREDGTDKGISNVDQVAHHRDSDWAVADELAGLTRPGSAAEPGVVVNSEEQLDGSPCRCRDGAMAARSPLAEVGESGPAGPSRSRSFVARMLAGPVPGQARSSRLIAVAGSLSELEIPVGLSASMARRTRASKA
jgi:hypothetical protein